MSFKNEFQKEKILIRGGGHKMAGGFTIDQNNIEKFKEFILKRFNKFFLLSKELI